MGLSAGQYEESEKELKAAAIAADASHNRVAAVKARVALAEMRLQNNQHSQSNRVVLSGIELPPNAPALNLLLGRAYAWTGDMDSARKQLQTLDASINQNDVPAVESLRHLLAAEIALAQRNFANAVEMAQKAANYQNTVFAVETLARCYAAAGMYEQAVQEYELLVTRSSELLDDTSNETFDQPAFRRAVEAHYRLAELYQKLGRTEQARTHLQTLMKYWAHADSKFLMYQDAQRLLRSLSAGTVPTPAM
jgi:tetratricopeptide (TPR) repeat protein